MELSLKEKLVADRRKAKKDTLTDRVLKAQIDFASAEQGLLDDHKHKTEAALEQAVLENASRRDAREIRLAEEASASARMEALMADAASPVEKTQARVLASSQARQQAQLKHRAVKARWMPTSCTYSCDAASSAQLLVIILVCNPELCQLRARCRWACAAGAGACGPATARLARQGAGFRHPHYRRA